ncbi:MAG: CARDB domain-containing protein, partial [Candidatus Binatia bacterium]
MLDADEAIEEGSESNNLAAATVELEAAPEGADLAVDSGGISFLPSTVVALPTEVSIVAIVRNLGKTDVDSATVRLLRGDPISGAIVAERALPLLAQSAVPVNFFDAITAPGSTAYTVVVDPAGEIAEAKETNNLATRTLETAPAIDFAVASEDLSLSGTSAHPGEEVTFRVLLRNRGTIGDGPFEVTYAVTDGTVTRSLQAHTILLAPGLTAERTVLWRVDLQGLLRFVVRVDPNGLVPERDETNNRAELEFDSAPIDVANLAIGADDLRFEPAPALEGSPLSLRATVRNTGGQASGPTRVAFFDGPPSAGLEIAGADLPALDPGALLEVTGIWSEVPDANE